MPSDIKLPKRSQAVTPSMTSLDTTATETPTTVTVRRRASRGYPKDERGYPDSPGHGYPKKTGYPKKDGYPYPSKGSLSSEEARKKRYEQEEKLREEMKKNKSTSPRCYLIYFFILLATLIGVSIGTYFAVRVAYPDDRVIKHASYAPESYRRAMVIMTDNLDCSLCMKRQTMKKVDLREVVIAGLQCLFINEPHSVAPDSGISILFFFKQDRESMARNIERGLMNGVCVIGHPNDSCDLQGFPSLITSRTDLSDLDFMHKGFNTEWLLPEDLYNYGYGTTFQRLARFPDHGDYNPYPQAMFTAGYKRSSTSGFTENTRIFRVSQLMASMVKQYKKSTTFGQNYTNVFQVGKDTQRKDRIVVTKNLARNVVNNFLYQSKSAQRKPIANFTRMHRLSSFAGKLALIPHVMQPNGPTHSIFASFIIQTVYNHVIQNEQREGDYTQAHVLGLIMKAQRLAYHFFVFSREWSGDENGISMMARTGLASQMLGEPLPKKLYRPLRKHPDRSVSIVIWSRNSQEELHVVGASLPQPFQSMHITGNRSGYERFEVKIGNTKYKSVPFTSFTGIVVTEELNLDSDTNHPQYVAACSGSVRNVEAVATSVLMQMLFKHSPGMAVWNASVFVDIRDGKMYCDNEGTGKDERYKAETKVLYEEAQKKSGLKCIPISAKDRIAKDRILMLASRPGTTSVQAKRDSILNPTKYMTGSMDPRAADYNYVVGY